MSTAIPLHAGKKESLGMGVLALACLLYAMDLTCCTWHIREQRRPSAVEHGAALDRRYLWVHSRRALIKWALLAIGSEGVGCC